MLGPLAQGLNNHNDKFKYNLSNTTEYENNIHAFTKQKVKLSNSYLVNISVGFPYGV